MHAGTVALAVLGCKVNQYELEAMREQFQLAGYQVVDFEQPADVYIVHTCTVTNLSDRKSRQLVRRAHRTNPQAMIAVTGCYAQMAPADVARLPGVLVVAGSSKRGEIVKLVEEARGQAYPLNTVQAWNSLKDFEELPVSSEHRVRAVVKIQEGCNRFCSYCIIPFARGPVRSRNPQAAIDEVRRLVAAGYAEIVLTGVHIGAYGRDLGGEWNLNRLILQLLAVPGLERLRVSSIDPDELDKELAATLTAHANVCPHYHIPLQSGDPVVLQTMRRSYTVDQYSNLVRLLRSQRPDAAITTDIMVGFPGEQEEQWLKTCTLVAELELSGLHVFPFSPRKGTPAASFASQVDPAEKERRSMVTRQLGQSLAQRYSSRFLHRVLMVVVESQGVSGRWEGHTTNYLRVSWEDQQALRGQEIPVLLERLEGPLVYGQRHGGRGEQI